METLLTTKELLELLKIDRTTVYRMLSDGRLTGIKVGNQWRFSKDEVDALISGKVKKTEIADPGFSNPLPIQCIQPIQDVFADISQIASLTTNAEGEPLTHVSNACEFCSLVMQSPSGKAACVASWKKLAHQSERQPRFVTCHAGLHYARARIEVVGELRAMVIAGQFYTERPAPSVERSRVEEIARKHGIEVQALVAAAGSIPVIDERKESLVGAWLEKIAHVFEHFGKERADLIGRLTHIAAVSTLTQ